MIDRFIRRLLQSLVDWWHGWRTPTVVLDGSGRIVISLEYAQVLRLEASFAPRLDVSLEELVRDGIAVDLAPVLFRYGSPPSGRVISVRSIGSLAAEHRRYPSPTRRSINSYFWVRPPAGTDLATLAADLRAVGSVRNAWLEPLVRASSPTSAAAAAAVEPNPQQRYIYGLHDPDQYDATSKSGVNAEAVWATYPGKDVTLASVDVGFKQHEDFSPNPPPDALVRGDNHTPYHGTEALGIVAARDNGFGIIGIAPSVTVAGVASVWSDASGSWVSDFSNAFMVAEGLLSPGDVILIEVDLLSSRVTMGSIRGGLPVEVFECWRTLIQAAKDKGIVVVEPAGNPECSGSKCDLGELPHKSGETPDRSMNPMDASFEDSGAILVGACRPGTNSVGNHELSKSDWWGARIDCYGWVAYAYTTTCYDGTDTCQQPADAKDYTMFGGTSAAAAMIAGAAVVIQDWFRTNTGMPATPARVREILRDTSLGVIVETPGDDRSMPDLGMIVDALDASFDVMVRDSLADVGVEPSTTVSMSPDVFVKQAPVSLPQYWDPDAFITNDEVTPGAANWLFIRIRNRAKHVPAVGVRARVYWAPSASLLVPSDWKQAADFLVGPIPADSFMVVSPPDPWIPDPAVLPKGSHACFIVVLDHPDDPAPVAASPLADWSAFKALIGSSNNVAWRNFNVVDPISVAPVPNPPPHGAAPDPSDPDAALPDAKWNARFRLRGAPEHRERFNLRLEIQGLHEGELHCKLPAHLATTLSRDIDLSGVREEPGEHAVVWIFREDTRVEFRGVELPADADEPLLLSLRPGDAVDVARTLVSFVQLTEEDDELGRVTWDFRVRTDAQPSDEGLR